MYATLVECQDVVNGYGAVTVTAAMHLASFRKTNSAIADKGETPPLVPDIYGLLTNAQINFLLELLVRSGLITTTTGEITKQVQGKVSVEAMPAAVRMTMKSEEFNMQMVAHPSFWQIGLWNVASWARLQYSTADLIGVGSDITARGAGNETLTSF